MFVRKNDRRVCQYAKGSGNIDIFGCAIENGFYWDIESESSMESAAITAAIKGQLEALKWIVEISPPGTIVYGHLKTDAVVRRSCADMRRSMGN